MLITVVGYERKRCFKAQKVFEGLKTQDHSSSISCSCEAVSQAVFGETCLRISLKASSNYYIFFFNAPKCWVLTFKDPSVLFDNLLKFLLIFLLSLLSIMGLPFLAPFLPLILPLSSSFLTKDLSLPPVQGVVLVRVFKEKLVPAQMGTTKDIIFRK